MIYDAFQKKAIEHINQGHSVLVSAPTGAGKTVIAEHVIQNCLDRGEKVIYTAPIKALSNQKYRDFQDNNQDEVGILTGDVTIHPQAPVLIMTTEIFRNKILEDKQSLKQYAWIIFDEIHYLDDYERGSVWEESLIFLPPHMNVLGLSATIPNILELARWLETIHQRPVKVVKEDQRPVPLHFLFQCQNKIYNHLQHLQKHGLRIPELRYYRGGKWPRHIRPKPNRLHSLIEHLSAGELLPCIYFVFSRKRAELLAEEMQSFDFLNDQEKRGIKKLYDQLCARFDLTKETSASKLRPLIMRGIGYHHAGMLPTLKEVVERLFTSRLLKIIFTTETFALGINMPARSVIFDELRKYYGKGFGPLKTRDFYQMAGRAGRRSIDSEGFVFCRINPHYISGAEIQRIIYSRSEKVYSQFNASYATLLNLYQRYGNTLYDIYPRSFHHFQVRKYLQKRAVDLLRAKVKILESLGHIQDDQLTPKGIFAGGVYGYELFLAEFYDQGILDALSQQDLGVLVMAVVYEPRKGAVKPVLDKKTKSLESTARKIKRLIHKIEKNHGLKNLSKRCYFHLTPVMVAWMKGESFAEILQYTDADEGEVVRFFRMTIQVLREMREAPISKDLEERIQNLIGLMNRDVVDSEKQLRS